ncbi:MAG: glycosyltransferase [Actinomycetota bacterium]|nr:glycosyltransferase [Actinomycetota bacterium]
MDPTESLAPPVVAVMVVHEPGAWFDEVLRSLAAQDYTNLKWLFLVAGEPGELPAMIRDTVPNSFVRAVAGNPGFGTAANEVLRLVEGDNGFFCFLHDDVALDAGAIRLLVEEMYRSNAGIVGPKLVTWERDFVLQHVGYGVDRFGEVDPIVEPGEIDQEQHDAVRDVFAVPAACLLVRADLFRVLGGFDPSIQYHGDDLDLCWRAHLGGARVVVVPAARVRHRERLAERRPDLRHAAMAARTRMRTVATLTGAGRLPMLSIQLVLVTLAESIVGLLTGRFRQVTASFSALLGMVPRSASYFARRRSLVALREVPDAEVAGLQMRGSARFTSYLRARDSRQVDPDSTTERRWRQTAGSAPALAWLAVGVLAVTGSRQLITGGVPSFGEFLPFPASPRSMIGDYLSGWSGHGLGSTTATPTGVALVAVGSIATLFHMALLQTVVVVGMLFAGYLGIWRLASLYPTARARIAALVVYAAVPLPAQLMSGGHWSALACYAAAPWGLHLLRRIAGIESSGSRHDDKVEHYSVVPTPRLVRRVAQLCLLTAVAFAFVPAFALVLVGMAVLLATATMLCGGRTRVAVTMVVAAFAASAVGVLVNLPWTMSLMGRDGWTSIVGVPVTASRALGIGNLARFLDDSAGPTIVAVALFVPVIVAPLVARAWRFTWAVRSALLVFGFGGLAVLDDRALLPFRMPEPGVLLVPVAIGVAMAAATLAAAFQDDVLGGSFGWRQPLGLLSGAAIAIGVVPGLITVSDGQWGMPNHTLISVLTQLPTDPVEGDYRVLWIGDPRAIPVAAYTYQPGIGYAITDDGPITIEHHWAGQPTSVEKEIAASLRQIADGVTLRGGRLLAQYGVRYVIVPLADGANGTIDRPVNAPFGLVDVLEDQLDLAAPLTRPPNYLIYENTAYAPTRSILTLTGATASQQAGSEAIAQADLRDSTPFAVGAPDRGDATGVVPEGTLHVAVPFDTNWHLTVNGTEVPARRAFGSTLAFDIPATGNAVLTYDTAVTRQLWLLAQLIAWGALVLTASNVRPLQWLRRRHGEIGVADHAIVADLRQPLPPAPLTDDDGADDWEEPDEWAGGVVAPDPWAEAGELAADDALGGDAAWDPARWEADS